MKIKTIGAFTSTIGKIEKKDKDLSDFVYEVAHLLNSKIQRRVQNKGLGSNDSPMKRYSAKYAIRKGATRRQSKFRDLTYTGNMWQSLTAEKLTNKQAKMFFGSATEQKKAYYNDQKTPFFSLSPSEQSVLHKELEEFAKL